jgi:hypothetical protein
MIRNRNFNGITLLWAFVACVFLGSGIVGRNLQTGIALHSGGADPFVYPILGFVVALGSLGIERLIKSDVPWRRRWWLEWPRGVRELLIVLIVACASVATGSFVRAALGSLDAAVLAITNSATAFAMWSSLALWHRWFHPSYIEE